METKIEAVPIAAFAQMRIVMSTKNDDPEGACRPFDKDRTGFVFGEAGALMVIETEEHAKARGASRPFDKDRTGFVFGEAGALMVIETEEHAKARGANILARIMGAGITSDGYHMVAPDPNGERAGDAMSRAIQLAGLTPGDIDHVNAHATGTSVGDLAESKAINNALGAHGGNAAVYAPKAALGHSVGAVGAVESILTVLALRDQVVPPTLRRSTWTWWRASRDRATTSTRSTTRSDSAGTTSHSPLDGTEPTLTQLPIALLPRATSEEETRDDDHGPRVGRRIARPPRPAVALEQLL